MSSSSPAPDGGTRPAAWRGWLPEVVLAGLVLVWGLLEVSRTYAVNGRADLLAVVVVLTAISVALFRHAPGAALATVWLLGGFQAVTSTQLLLTQAAVTVVAYGCARWGHLTTVVLSGISIPAAAAVALALTALGSRGYFRGIGLFTGLVDRSFYSSSITPITALGTGLLLLIAPWLAGLTIRASARARRSQISQVAAEQDAAQAHDAAQQAQEIARLRDDQARLARDVHDVVGHSLAVILAQAESAQYLPDDPATLKSTLSTIATSARGSLGDVRQVLSSTRSTESTPAAPPGTAQGLVDGVRASGREVRLEEVGTPRPLPPELEVVAHRVLQEMLTNAVRHGVRDRPILVERHWPAGGLERDLRIEVRNVAPAHDPDPVPDPEETRPIRVGTADPDAGSGSVGDGGGSGQGVDGMRRRLDSVGGRLDVRRRHDEFTTTAWVPVRAR